MVREALASKGFIDTPLVAPVVVTTTLPPDVRVKVTPTGSREGLKAATSEGVVIRGLFAEEVSSWLGDEGDCSGQVHTMAQAL